MFSMRGREVYDVCTEGPVIIFFKLKNSEQIKLFVKKPFPCTVFLVNCSMLDLKFCHFVSYPVKDALLFSFVGPRFWSPCLRALLICILFFPTQVRFKIPLFSAKNACPPPPAPPPPIKKFLSSAILNPRNTGDTFMYGMYKIFRWLSKLLRYLKGQCPAMNKDLSLCRLCSFYTHRWYVLLMYF